MGLETSPFLCDNNSADLENHPKIVTYLSVSTVQQKTPSITLKNKGILYQFSEEDEKKLVKKLDYCVIPLLCLFYFMDFLDRGNIGNAKLAGIQEDLSMTGDELSIAISGFFITYIIFEVPSNIILKKTSTAKWLSFTMLIWGFATLMSAFVTNFTGLFIARLILGAAESGYVPGIMFLLSKVYTPDEFSFRVSILLTSGALAILASGPLAYCMSYLDGIKNLHDWQYLFIFEGLPTIALSVVSYFLLFDDLQRVKWLSVDQKLLHAARMAKEYHGEHDNGKVGLSTLKIVLFDWKTWAFALVFFLNNVNITSLILFTPTLISGFGFPKVESQLLAGPPFAIATFGALIGGYLTGKFSKRSPFLAGGSFITAIGYFCLIIFHNKWALYTTLLLVPIGIGAQAAAAIGWSAINYQDLSVRAVAVATVLMIGNLGSVIASFLFQENDAPRYVFALAFNSITALVSCFLSSITGYLLYKENCKRDKNPDKYDQFRYFC